jgi:hypothetical protein
MIIPVVHVGANGGMMLTRSRRFPWAPLTAILFVLPMLASLALDRAASASQASTREVTFVDPVSQSAEFIGYNKSIALTPDQKALRDRTLSGIAAPCCDKFTAATCCCPCNLAKSIWGLTNYLIVHQNAHETQIRQSVRGWLAFINSKGFSGNACDTAGGCGRAYSRDGCGGMDEKNLVASR